MKLLDRIYVPNWVDAYKWQIPIKLFLNFAVPEGWEKTSLKNVLMQVEEKEKVIPDKDYKLAGVKWYGEGLFFRETQKGDDLSASWLTPLVQDAFIYNRLFAWKESFAIVTEEFRGLYVSNEFPQFIVKSNKVLPKYLLLFFLQPDVIKAVNKASAGSAAVSRNRFKEEDFLEFEILVPPLRIQKEIIKSYEDELQSIGNADDKIKQIEQEIDQIFLRELNITFPEYKTKKPFFCVSYDEIERWDTFFFNEKFRIINVELKKHNSENLASCVHFIKRTWKNDDFPSGTFKYVQIGDVNIADGITDAKETNVSEAPSRAQQIIKSGDIILSTTRPYLGAFAMVSDEYNDCVASSGFSVIDKVNPSYNKEFILHFLKSRIGLLQFEQRMTGGLYPAITQDQLERILIPKLEIKMQNNIVNMINTKKTLIKNISDQRKEEKALVIHKIGHRIFPIN